MRDFSVFEGLQLMLDRVPLAERAAATFEFSLNEGNLSSNVELIYRLTTQRLSHLSYYLEWAKTLDENDTLKPAFPPDRNPDQILPSFHRIEELGSAETRMLNNSLANWITNQVIRDLNEFLMYYLLGVYETCVLATHAKKSITPREVMEGKKRSERFEGNGLKDRLKILRKEFKLDLTHKQEAYSLYELRNIFSHFDGKVQRKFCKDKGRLKISWPSNSFKAKIRGQDKWVRYDKIPKPFSGDDYEQIQVTWLDKPNVVFYKPGDKIQLSFEQLSDLIFFYLYIFGELQKGLVALMLTRGVKVKSFDDYALLPTIIGVVEENAHSDGANSKR